LPKREETIVCGNDEPQFNDFNSTSSRRTVMQNMNGIAEGTALRELSLDEAEMVGGGGVSPWGLLGHEVANVYDKASHSLESKNWSDVLTAAGVGTATGAGLGAGIGLLGGPFAPVTVPAGVTAGAAIGGLFGMGLDLAHQFHLA
jgi:hypothetical protein